MIAGNIVGLIGGALISISFIPQLMRVFRLKSAHEISVWFTSIMLTGCILWTYYGFYFNLVPVMVFSVLNTTQVALLLILKFIYGREIKSSYN